MVCLVVISMILLDQIKQYIAFKNKPSESDEALVTVKERRKRRTMLHAREITPIASPVRLCL